MSLMKASNHRAHCMRGISSRFSSGFIVPSWQLLSDLSKPGTTSFRGAEGIVSVTEPLPGQIPRAPLLPLASAGLFLPSPCLLPQLCCCRAHLECVSPPGHL